jgi:hypothetical protein
MTKQSMTIAIRTAKTGTFHLWAMPAHTPKIMTSSPLR